MPDVTRKYLDEEPNGLKRLFAIAFFFYLSFLFIARSLGGWYLDERYYIESGIRYARCLPPAFSNPEHPPLGKYVIGALAAPYPGIASAGSGILATVILAATLSRIRSGVLVPTLAVLTLVSEMAFVKSFNYALLDPIAVGFSAAATYISLFYSRPLLSGSLWGAALASKLSATYPFLGVLLFRVWERRYRDALLEILAASAVYVASFLGDVVCPGGSLDLLVSHLLFVPTYMLSVHRLSVYKAVQGLSVALLKLGFWASRPPVTVTVVPDVTTEVNLTLGSASSIEVHFYFWLSGLLMPSSIALLTYALLRFKSLSRESRLITVATLLSYVNVLHGAVFWYLTLPVYYLALLAGIVLNRRTLLVLAVANVVSLMAVYLLGLTDTLVVTI